MQHQRRHRMRQAPVRAGWELPAAVILCLTFAIVLAPLVVQALAGAATTGGLLWPHGHVVQAVIGVAHGNFGVGLDPVEAAALPGAPVLWVAIVATEALVLALAWTCYRSGWRHHAGPTGRGMATTRETAAALGVGRLRTRASIVRPDLQSRRRWGRR